MKIGLLVSLIGFYLPVTFAAQNIGELTAA